MLKSFQLKRRNTGAALLEFALVLPLFLIISVFVLELGMIFIQDNTLNKSVRESVRYLSAHAQKDGCAPAVANQVIEANMDSLFDGAFADFDAGSGDSYSAAFLCVNETSGAIADTEVMGASCAEVTMTCATGTHLHVRVSATHHPKMLSPGLMGFNLPSGYALSASYIMRVL
jgi:hypothetical protein